MAEIPLGFSFEETDAGFVLRNKTENGSVTEIAIPPEDIILLKSVVDLWSDRLLLSLPGAGSTAVPVLVHWIENTAVVEHPQGEHVILLAQGRGGSQINLQLPLTLADLLAHDMTELVAKMKAGSPGTATRLI
jgi:hypothetical protein